ncbi:hypothetical protein OOK36_48430 [Streptomyces sp. NBC_00365]|uniref:hypothetical protein n=1 Tax=Streptomyces sp. NBC_00365 TaxID=2975726 RepID=UPI00225530BD|nr:hypothetical protein [Streptomyces sp. NBC_00365]MCX5096439.1 hypothetical protein [Streptomyces sp. NBC_00365]
MGPHPERWQGPRRIHGQPQRVQAALTCPHTLITLPETEGAGEHCHVGAMSRFHQSTFDWLDTTLTPATQPTS